MFKPIRWYSKERGYRVGAIVEYGGDTLTILMVDRVVRAKKLPLMEEKFMRPLTKNGQDYPPDSLRESMLEAADRLGVTKAAKRHLETGAR